MKEVVPFLNFDGNCFEAMTFYAKCFEARLHVVRFADVPGIPWQAWDRIMHATLTKGSTILLAADTVLGMPVQTSEHFRISIHCESAEELDRLFAALSENGDPSTPPQDVFQGTRFGMLTDQFGIQWMFKFEQP